MKTKITTLILFAFAINLLNAQFLYEHVSQPDAVGYSSSEYADGHFLITGSSSHETESLNEAFVSEVDSDGTFVRILKSFTSSNREISGKATIPFEDGSFLWFVDKDEELENCIINIHKINADFSEAWKKSYCFSNAQQIYLENVLPLTDGFLLYGTVFLEMWYQPYYAKLDFEGTLIWENALPFEKAEAIESTSDGMNLFSVSRIGQFNMDDSVIFTSLIIKSDLDGNFLDTLSFDGLLHGIAIDTEGDLLLSGTANHKGFIGKASDQLEWIWQKDDSQYGEESLLFKQVKVHPNGHIICAGNLKTEDLPFDDDLFIMALDNNGEQIWKQFYELSGYYENVKELKFAENGKIMVTGIMGGALDLFGSDGHAFFMLLNEEGELLSSKEPVLYDDYKIDILPNPAQDWLALRSSDLLIGNVELFNITGQLTGTWDFQPSESQRMMLPKSTTGIHVLKIYTREGIVFRKILILD